MTYRQIPEKYFKASKPTPGKFALNFNPAGLRFEKQCNRCYTYCSSPSCIGGKNQQNSLHNNYRHKLQSDILDNWQTYMEPQNSSRVACLVGILDLKNTMFKKRA